MDFKLFSDDSQGFSYVFIDFDYLVEAANRFAGLFWWSGRYFSLSLGNLSLGHGRRRFESPSTGARRQVMIEIGFGVNKRDKDVFFHWRCWNETHGKEGNICNKMGSCWNWETDILWNHNATWMIPISPEKVVCIPKILIMTYDRFKRWFRRVCNKWNRKKSDYRGAGYCGHRPESQWCVLFDATDLLLWCSSLSRIWYRTPTKSGKIWLKSHYHVS